MSLDDISYSGGEMRYANHRTQGPSDLDAHLAEAIRLCDEANSRPPVACGPPSTNNDFEHLRWFPYPGEHRSTAL
jgi:hypothetical protein